MYTLSGVTKTYRKRGNTVAAVQDVDLSIANG
jgi:ABC-type methionine transport system ATPase subunit